MTPSDAAAKLATRLHDVIDTIKAVRGEKDGISPHRCEAIIERCEATLKETSAALDSPWSAEDQRQAEGLAGAR